jgi:hypothetical protein
MKYVYNAIGFLIKPSKNFDSIKRYRLGEAFKFMLIISIFFAALNGIVGTLISYYIQPMLGLPMVYPAELMPLMIAANTIGSYILIVISLTIWSLWQHLWAYVFGAKKGIEQTMKSVFYGTSPFFLLGWIPLVSIVSVIWSLVLHGIGIKRLHGIETGKAALAIIIAVLIPLIIVAAFLLNALLSLMAFNPYTATGY